MVGSAQFTLYLALSLMCLATVHSQRIPTSLSDAQQQATDLLNKIPKPSLDNLPNMPNMPNMPNLSNLMPNGLPSMPNMPNMPNLPNMPSIQAPSMPTLDLPGLNGVLSMINKLPGQLQGLVNGLLTNLTKMLPSLGSGGQLGRRR